MSRSEVMRAVGLYRYLPIDHSGSLVSATVPRPIPDGRDLLVRVKAVAVNPVDIKVRSPRERVEEKLRILGWDAAGTVEETGPECMLFKPGDEVYYSGCITKPGTNSEYHRVDERIVGRKPASLDYGEAAALPLTAITAWEAIFERLHVPADPAQNRGKAMLIIGAAGGVGSIAVQLARHAGLTVIGTASRTESADWVKRCGADHVIDHNEEMLPQLQAIGIAQVPYIFCLHDTDRYWASMARLIAPQGRICAIVPTKQAVDLAVLHSKSVTFVWELMFTRPANRTDDMEEQHRLLNRISALVDQGVFRSTMTTRLSPISAENLKQAHALIEGGRTLGKIVIEGPFV